VVQKLKVREIIFHFIPQKQVGLDILAFTLFPNLLIRYIVIFIVFRDELSYTTPSVVVKALPKPPLREIVLDALSCDELCSTDGTGSFESGTSSDRISSSSCTQNLKPDLSSSFNPSGSVFTSNISADIKTLNHQMLALKLDKAEAHLETAALRADSGLHRSRPKPYLMKPPTSDSDDFESCEVASTYRPRTPKSSAGGLSTTQSHITIPSIGFNDINEMNPSSVSFPMHVASKAPKGVRNLKLQYAQEVREKLGKATDSKSYAKKEQSKHLSVFNTEAKRVSSEFDSREVEVPVAPVEPDDFQCEDTLMIDGPLVDKDPPYDSYSDSLSDSDVGGSLNMRAKAYVEHIPPEGPAPGAKFMWCQKKVNKNRYSLFLLSIAHC